MATKKSNNFIKKAIGKPGALHKALGIPLGQKIGPARLAAAAKRGGTIGREANLALTLNGLRKGKKNGPKSKGSKGRR